MQQNQIDTGCSKLVYKMSEEELATVMPKTFSEIKSTLKRLVKWLHARRCDELALRWACNEKRLPLNRKKLRRLISS